MSLGFRVRQCPRNCKPSAVKNWSPNACSSSLFFGATTARIERLPAVLIRSRIPIVLPAPGSATITCQERFSNAVSMKISLRKREWVMAVAPLASCERVRHVLDDQVRHPGQPPAVLRLSGSAPRYSLIAQLLLLYECLGVDDPIDDLARLDESLRFDDGAPPQLRPEYERGLAVLVHERSWPAPRRVCAWLWLPTH